MEYDDDATFIKFRYTLRHDESLDQLQGIFSVYTQMLCGEEDYENVFMTGGFENLNKLNQPTHPHIHIHLVIKNRKIEAIRKKLQRHFKAVNEERKGNILYSLAEEKEIRDLNRFLRYPWKQGGPMMDYQNVPDGFDIDLETKLAKEEQNRAWDLNMKKHEKAMGPSTKDKLFEYLLQCNEEKAFTDKVDIVEKILIYFTENEMMCNKTSVIAYAQTASFKFGLETQRSVAIEWMR